MLAELVYYVSPGLIAAGHGESLRTRRVVDAYAAAREFLRTCTSAGRLRRARLNRAGTDYVLGVMP